jgi:hypothetical protein
VRVNSVRAGAPRRVFLHVGSPKTGTTYLQNILWAQKQVAAEQGLLLPLERFADHYLATLDVRGQASRRVHPPRAQGIWQRLVAEAVDWSGDVLVSHELFAAATAEQAEAAVRSFPGDVEVHVVLTTRDLVRQMSAEWQEHVKHRSVQTFGEFVAAVRADTRRESWFWRVQDFAGVAERWGSTLPPAQVHVVTVPPPGAPPETLWSRYATLLGLDPTSFDTEVSRSNTSLGVEQAELLRRVNLELGDRLPLPGPYPTVVKDVLAHRVLAARPGTRLALTLSDTEYALEQSHAVAERIRSLDVDVVGSLDELVPDADVALAAARATAYDRPSEEILLAESVAAMAELLVALADRRAERRRNDELVGRMRQRPFRVALAQASEEKPWLMGVRKVYDATARVVRRPRTPAG